MIPSLLRPAFFVTASLFLAAGVPGQTAPAAPKVDFPTPSPSATVKQRVGLTDIEIAYSRPGVKGRQIFGGTEAYGRVWRTGANNATRLTFSTPVKFHGAQLDAGTYELFTIPNKTEWTVIVQKAAKQWGAYQYDQKNDAARVTVKPIALADSVETFAIELNDITDDSTRNCTRISSRRAPTDFRMPISWVRSVTEASMIFMITTPPIIRKMETTPMEALARPPKMLFHRLRSDSLAMIPKASSCL